MAASAATHVLRLMLALVMPVLARSSLGACSAALDTPLWARARCMAAQAPLLQLLLLQAALLLGGFWASALLPLPGSRPAAQVCCVSQPTLDAVHLISEISRPLQGATRPYCQDRPVFARSAMWRAPM